jgi:predicted metal-dependent hydrolase
LLEKVKRTLGIEDSVRLVLYPMKYKVASISLRTKTIRLNKNLVSVFNEEELRYILAHELIHIKTMSLNHGKAFHKLLNSLYAQGESEEIENKIVKKLLEFGINTKRWLP